MKLWKSPVFYFGIMLILAVTALLVAPFVIDWNSYRADLETYGRKLTGREVAIGGNVSARLFPWPKLTVEDVRIANPPGLAEPEFARAARIVVRMSLAGLLRGDIEVERIDAENPVIAIERLEAGEGNWQFHPAADLVKSDLLARVKLDSITLRDGVVRITDRRRGEVHQFDDVNASLAAPQIVGPWRLRSVSLYGGHAMDIGINTGIWKPDEPMRFSVRVANADGSGLVYNFDGAEVDAKVEGEVRIEPAADVTGKVDAEGQLRPLVFKSKVAASFDEVSLDQIEIAPRDIRQGGTLMSGSAKFKLGNHITAMADLSAATLNLDELAGAQARAMLREGGILRLADGLLGLMPNDLSLAGSVKVTALTLGGETLDNVALSIDADRNAIRLHELSASLPGRSRALYQGVFFPGKGGAELAGSLAVESSDLRQLVSWLWPEGRDRIKDVWTGSRGQFKLQTDVAMTPSRLRFTKTEYEIDGERGSGEIILSAGGRGSVDIRVDTGRFDLDNFAAGGLSAFSLAGVEGLGGLVGYFSPGGEVPDLRVTVQAGELRLNGVAAADVALDLAAGVTGFDLRTLSIGSVGGARVEAQGLILGSDAGPDGSIGLDVTAEDPRELIRLVGLLPAAGGDPAWVQGLGRTALKGTLNFKPRDGTSEALFDVEGNAGDIAITASGQVRHAGSPKGAEISLAGDIRTASSGRLAAMAGLAPAAADNFPGRMAVTLSGTLADGFAADLQVDAYGGRHAYVGQMKPMAPGWGLDGKLSLRFTELTSVGAALGLPVDLPQSAVMVMDAALSSDAEALRISGIDGRVGTSPVTGEITIATGGKVTANVETGELAVADVLGLALLDWSGNRAGLESAFATALPFGLTGEIWITPSALQVHAPFVAKEAQIGMTASTDEIRVAIYGKDPAGGEAHVEIASRGTSSSRKLTGKISLPMDLGRQLQRAGGGNVAEGRGLVELGFASEGRSPGGALAGLKGSGTYRFDGFKLPGISPDEFLRQIAVAKDGAGVTAAFDALRGGDGLSTGRVAGFITVDNGEVAFQPMAITTDEAAATIRILGELALGEIDASVALRFTGRDDLPGMSIAYAGPPSALLRTEDSAELSTRLGVTIMQQGIDELERLQKEQERLAREEERQRREDEARLEAYYAQRDELILRRRELKVHAEMRVLEAELLRQRLEAERAANAEINKAELKQRVREVRVLRQIARAERAAASRSGATEAPPKPKPQSRPPPKPRQTPPPGPVIIEQPEGAPVLISPAPSSSPSQ
ncbi:MAG: AsmA family protein [Alphaproteobacteria bacterium]|nr:AsmA family protein [Alphaproteobacteria bacterium]